MAPVPWFPFTQAMFGDYAKHASAPERAVRHGVDVFHPRYLIPPKTAMRAAPASLTRCLRRKAHDLIADGWDFDFIDAHYIYPDGVAAMRVARELGKPLIVTARGTDINLLPNFAGPRKQILEVAQRADSVIAVAAALKTELSRLGAPAEKIRVLRNGVDLEKFRPVDQAGARRALGVDGLVLASVGHLVERKGHDLVIEALRDLPDATLLIAGEGPEQRRLEALAKNNQLDGRVRFLGRLDHGALRDLYSAADILVLASSREGWPNVLLEAMACGAPCVATNVWGTGEVIRAPEAGRLAETRNAEDVAAAVKEVVAAGIDRQATRDYAERHSWNETVDGMHAIFSELEEKTRLERRMRMSPFVLAESAYKPRLIVTVDTEEEFDWQSFETTKHVVSEITGIERFHKVCGAFEAKPLYFLTWPMLKNAAAAAFFRALHDAGEANMGLHLHQWVTPPGEQLGEFYSFQKNLPPAVYRKKLRSLADLFVEVFGQNASAHRAGRYGIGRWDYALLAEAGIAFDFSPSTAFDFSMRGGPDFSAMSNYPFLVEGEHWKVAVTPVCGGKALRHTRQFLSQENAAPGFAKFQPDKFSAMKRPMRLSPEGASLSDLQALTRRLVADKTPILTFSLHSTTLTPGANAYAPDESEVEEMLRTITDYFGWFRDRLGGEIVSFSDLRRLYEAARPMA